MSRSLDDLDPRFRPLVFELLARFTEAGLQVQIVDTLRTPKEQADALRRGVSWVQHSKHLDGLAIDLCPWKAWLLQGARKLEWDAADPVWAQMGACGEKLGLRWGGRWQQRDLGHFEYIAHG